MKISKTLILSILFLSLIQLGLSKKIDSDTLRFSLCNDNIEWAVKSSYWNNHAIAIQLKPDATIEFAKLTGNNIGQPLEILFNNKVVVSAIIETRIPNGRISIKLNSRKEAKKLHKDLLKSTPNQLCGVIAK